MAEWLRRQTVNLLGFRRWFESSSTHVNLLLLANLQSVAWQRPMRCRVLREAYLRQVTYACYLYYLTQYHGSAALWLVCGLFLKNT
jgi:hypothetical protein